MSGTRGVAARRTGPRSGPARATAPARRRAPGGTRGVAARRTGPRSGPAGVTAPARRKARSQASGASARHLRENEKNRRAPGERQAVLVVEARIVDPHRDLAFGQVGLGQSRDPGAVFTVPPVDDERPVAVRHSASPDVNDMKKTLTLGLQLSSFPWKLYTYPDIRPYPRHPEDRAKGHEISYFQGVSSGWRSSSGSGSP